MEILTVGERIALYRKRNGFTKKELAQMTGVTVRTISSYEDDKSMPNSDIQIRIASALNMSLNKLLYGFEDPAKGKAIEPLIKGLC